MHSKLAGMLIVTAFLVTTPAFAIPSFAATPLPETTANLSRVLGPYGVCVWTRLLAWHQAGRFGTWRSCQPGAGWRYESRCWIGPGGEHHCRFYG